MFFSANLFLTLSLFTSIGLSAPNPRSQWRTLANITVAARQEHTTVFLPPHTVAILGGIVPSTNFPPPTTDLVQFYSIPDNTWRTVAPLPRPLNHVNVAVSNGKIYVLGGLTVITEETPPAWRAVPDSYVYNPETNTWSSIEPIPVEQARGSAAVGVYQGKIYLAGGMTELVLGPNGTQATVDTVSIFDTRTGRWQSVPADARRIPGARDHSGVAVVDGKFYVLGGRDHGQFEVKDTVFVLDLNNVQRGWRTSRSRLPTPRGGLAAGVVGKKVYTFGGEGNRDDESGVFNQTEVYDTVRDRWERLSPMEIPRHGSFAVGVGKSVYIPGGGTRLGGSAVASFNAFSP